MNVVYKRTLSLLTAMVLVVSIAPSTAFAASNAGDRSASTIEAAAKWVFVKDITLNMEAKTLKVKETVRLKATISPANASNKKVTWKSSNPTVAKVSKNGKVTALKKGKATITATACSGKKARTTILVDNKAMSVKGVKLHRTTASLEVGLNLALIPTLNPKNAKTKTIKWSSNCTRVATVSSNGVVFAKAAGTVIITATTKDGGRKATCTITIQESPAAEKELWARFLAGDYTDIAGTWENGNGDKVTISPDGTYTDPRFVTRLSSPFKDSKQDYAPCVSYGASLEGAGILFIPAGQELLVWDGISGGKVRIMDSDIQKIRMVGPTQDILRSVSMSPALIWYKV